jgi:saccharopine dehydrogenase-like NADP-dependent oxidoreductase
LTRTLDVAVLGAGGTIAPALVHDLAESAEVGSLLLLDLDGERAARVAERHGAGRAQARRVNGGCQDLSRALTGRDVLVNAASYRANLDAMRACVDAGCTYIDLGGLYWMTGRQLELHDLFRHAGLLALLGMGGSPGKTNVMAARAVRELGEPPAAVHVTAAGRDLGADPSGPLSVPYSLRTLVDELTMAPVEIRDGAPAELAPLAPGGRVRLPAPIGRADTIHTIHSEMRTFGESFGCAEASFRLSLAPTLLARLRELAERPNEVDAAARRALPPSADTVSVHRVEAVGSERSVSVTAVTSPAPQWGLGGGIISTAAPAAAAVRLLARGRIGATGVLPPERCVEPDDLFPELERHGCEFSIATTEVAHA